MIKAFLIIKWHTYTLANANVYCGRFCWCGCSH